MAQKLIKGMLIFYFILKVVSCNTTNSNGLVFHFYIRNEKGNYEQLVFFDNNDIQVINWDHQTFKIKNKMKMGIVDQYYQYKSGAYSYISVTYNDSFLYNVSIIPNAAAGQYCSSCPRIYIGNNNNVFSDQSYLEFYFGYPSMDRKYQTIKNSVVVY